MNFDTTIELAKDLMYDLSEEQQNKLMEELQILYMLEDVDETILLDCIFNQK